MKRGERKAMSYVSLDQNSLNLLGLVVMPWRSGRGGRVQILPLAAGNIETTADADWFAINLVAGTTYQFDLKGSDTGDGALDSLQLELHGPGGNLLLSDLQSGEFDGPGPGWSSNRELVVQTRYLFAPLDLHKPPGTGQQFI
jgi:serralysin